MSDAARGGGALAGAGAGIAALLLWINSYPFLDEELKLYSWVPDPQWFLLFCGVWGLCFVGGLMCFTLCHLWPYL